MKTFFKESLRTVIIIGVLFGVVTLVSAWTAPTQAPTGGNVAAPINVGSVEQYKSGALGIGGVFKAYSDAIFSGKVGIGTASPSQKLDVAGNVKGTGLCIGSDCRTSWPGAGGITPVNKGPYGVGVDQEVGNYTFCALSTVTFNRHYPGKYPSGTDQGHNCSLSQQNGFWKLTVQISGGGSIACSVYCF